MQYLSLFIVLTFCIGFILSGHLNIFRQDQQLQSYYGYVHNPSRLLVCISDDPRDAVIWNNQIEWNPSSSDEVYNDDLTDFVFPTNRSNEEKLCDIDIESWECFSEWNHHYFQWNKTYSFHVPMGPVYDCRWENFKEFSKLDETDPNFNPVKKNRDQNSTYFSFHESGALVVSIRGSSNAQFLLCKSQNYITSFCYWVIIGGWGNTITAIRKCENGIPSGLPVAGSNCSVLRASVTQHFPLNEFEWKTFIIDWDRKSQTIKLYNPNELILSYTDPDFTSSNKVEIHYVFYGNPDPKIKMLFRFHEYHYILTNQLDAKLTSPPVSADNFHTICIDMLIGLCLECELLVNLVDGNGTKQITELITRSPAYHNIQHDLPTWQYFRINASNVDNYPSPITLEFITKLSTTGNDIKHHWALTRFEKCLPNQAVKTIATNVMGLNNYPFLSWPNVTCQRFSYNKQNEEILSSIANFYYPPEDFRLCPNFSFGPHCATPCSKYFNYFCNHLTMCTQDGCFCAQGYSGFKCQKSCERGSFGYECRKLCSNCIAERCDAYDGRCDSGCIESPDRFHIPPYCDIVIESPPSPSVDHINETTVRVFLLELNEYKHVIILFIFEIESDTENSQSKLATEEYIKINNIEKKIYSAVFTNLTVGTKYSVRSLSTIHYDENQYKHMEGARKTFSTSCDWDSKFEIKPGERSILLERVSQKQHSPCADNWYSVELAMISSSTNKSYSIDINHIPHKFPMLFSNLAPYTDFKICIRNLDVKFSYYQQVQTLEAEPSEVELIKPDSVYATEAIIEWFPPIFPNGKILGYNLTIQVIQHAGCEDNYLITPKHLIDPRTVIINDSETFRMSYKFINLIPYVMYEITIRAFNTKIGVESKTRMDTDQLEIPTEIFEDLKFENDLITWKKPSNCSTITGPIVDARFLLVGLSQSVKNFSYQSLKGEFTVNLTNIDGIYGSEQYRARVYVLHYPKRLHNETAYAEISFVTNPRPPPKVELLEIIEVNQQEQTLKLRWKKPTPPTNGEIIYYAIRFSGINIETTDIAYVYPNETCQLWTDLICAVIKQPFGTREFIEVRAYNKDVNKAGDVNTVEYQHHEGAPSLPELISINEINKGVIDIQWKHPYITGGPLKSFMINVEIISSRLEKLKDYFHKNVKNIDLPIQEYKKDYSTRVYLLPSTLYKISIKATTKSQNGSESIAHIETRSTLSFEFEPHLIVGDDDSTIKLVIPSIINNTVNSLLNIVVKGGLMCEQGAILELTLETDVGLEYHESAWLAASFTTRKKVNRIFVVGDGQSYNGNINCPLHKEISYVIVIVVYESDTIKSIIWKSPSFTVGMNSKKSYILYWLIPLLLLLIVFIGLIYFYVKRGDSTAKSDRFLVRHLNKQVKSVNRIHTVSPDMLDHQELISLNPSTSIEELSSFTPFSAMNKNFYNRN